MLSFTKNRDQPQNRQVCLTTPLCREEQVLRSSLLLAYHTPTQDPYGQATLCSDGSLAGLSSVSLSKPFTITTSEAAGWMNIYSFATLGIPPTRMG